MTRPSGCTPEISEAIFERLELGESLVSICRSEGMPSVRTVLRWADEREDFGEEYRRAQAAAAEYLNHRISEVAESATDKDSAAAARVRIEAMRWQASKQAPRKFGDKLDLQVTPDFNLAAELQQRREKLQERRATYLNGAPAIQIIEQESSS